MKSLNEHLSVIFPLIAFLISYEFYNISTNLTLKYSESINNNYAIVVVSEIELTYDYLSKKNPLINELIVVEPDSVIDKLENKISDANLALLKVSMPKFYKIKLKQLPSTEDLSKLSKMLKNIKGIKRVESYKRSHEVVYNMLTFFKYITLIFFSLILVLSFFIILK